MLFLGHSGFHTINEATPPVLAALVVNELSPEICGLIKRQKRGWEAIGLTELVTIAEHFERTLDRDHKQRPAKRMAAQLQQFRARDQSNTWTSHIISSRGPSSKVCPRGRCPFLMNWDTGEKIVLQDPMQIPQGPQVRAPRGNPPKTDRALRHLLANCYQKYPYTAKRIYDFSYWKNLPNSARYQSYFKPHFHRTANLWK